MNSTQFLIQQNNNMVQQTLWNQTLYNSASSSDKSSIYVPMWIIWGILGVMGIICIVLFAWIIWDTRSIKK